VSTTSQRTYSTRKNLARLALLALLALLAGGCAAPWAVRGGDSGPAECTNMCKGWGMQLTGMVGVGAQGPAGGGATACVCELPRPVQGPKSTAARAAAVAALSHFHQQQAMQQQAH
jgi:hypothetical protein